MLHGDLSGNNVLLAAAPEDPRTFVAKVSAVTVLLDPNPETLLLRQPPPPLLVLGRWPASRGSSVAVWLRGGNGARSRVKRR